MRILEKILDLVYFQVSRKLDILLQILSKTVSRVEKTLQKAKPILIPSHKSRETGSRAYYNPISEVEKTLEKAKAHSDFITEIKINCLQSQENSAKKQSLF